MLRVDVAKHGHVDVVRVSSQISGRVLFELTVAPSHFPQSIAGLESAIGRTIINEVIDVRVKLTPPQGS